MEYHQGNLNLESSLGELTMGIFMYTMQQVLLRGMKPMPLHYNWINILAQCKLWTLMHSRRTCLHQVNTYWHEHMGVVGGGRLWPVQAIFLDEIVIEFVTDNVIKIYIKNFYILIPWSKRVL